MLLYLRDESTRAKPSGFITPILSAITVLMATGYATKSCSHNGIFHVDSGALTVFRSDSEFYTALLFCKN